MNKSKNLNLVSSTNISMTKTEYQKALDHFKLDGKSVREASSKMKFVKKRGENKDSQAFRERFENYIVRKWKNETFKYTATYNIRFSRLNKKGNWEKSAIQFQVQGLKKELKDKAEKVYENRRESLESDYPEWKDFQLDEDPVGELQPVKSGEGVYVKNQKVETTSKGGQRIVFNKGHKSHIKMRDNFYLKVNGEQEWDTGNGTCVFDYIYWYYKDQKGFKRKFKDREKTYQYLNEVFKIDETENPLVEGVSISQLENFCDEFGVCMYSYDKTFKEIVRYTPKVKLDNCNSNGRPLVFICYDEHFYPVDEKDRKSVVNRTSHIGSTTIVKTKDEEGFSKKDKPIKQVIAPTKEEYDAVKTELEELNYPMSVCNKIAFNMLKENKFNIPFPIDERSIKVDDNQIKRIIYDDKIIMTEPIFDNVKEYYEKKGKEYQGETYISILNEIWRNKYGWDSITKADFMSVPNGEVFNALNSPKVKWRTHLGMTKEGEQADIKNLLETGKAIAVDICKCYADCLYNPRERWIVFNGKEKLEVYDKNPLTLGLYFVVTNDMTLLHRSNWYSKQILEKAKKERISFKITHQIRCVDIEWKKDFNFGTDEEPNIVKLDNTDLFSSFIDDVVELTELDRDFTLTKLIVNSISGYLGKTNYDVKSASIGKGLTEVWEDWIVPEVADNPDAETYILPVGDDDNKLYLYGYVNKVENITNGLPMYIQVLDWSNMALYDMTKRVGGTLLYRKTDMIISKGGKLPTEYTIKPNSSYTETFGKYRIEENASQFTYRFEKDERAVETPKIADDWTYWDFNDSDDWKFILEKAIKNGGMLVKGRAGTGKSYIVEQGIKNGYLPTDPRTRLSLTNRAARNIGGTTIHKALGINEKNKFTNTMISAINASKIKILNDEGVYKDYNIFVVDEISMIDANLWNKLLVLKKKSNNAVFILLGDYRQCPPIEDGKTIDCFNHPYTKILTNSNCCELMKPKRYDVELWNWLEDYYEEGIEGEQILKKKIGIENILYRKNICFTNKMRMTINELCMAEMIKGITKYVVFEAPENDDKNTKSQRTYIYAGLPIMAVVANKELELVNSDEFVVKDFDPNASTMEIDGEVGNFTIAFKDFHKYFVVNYASTTHKSQGATIEEDINIFEWDKLCWDSRFGYTAVSRAKKCEQVTIVENMADFETL